MTGRRFISATFAMFAVICCPMANAGYSDGVAAYHTLSLEGGVRYWRRAAWRQGDFLSELRLADIYGNSTDTKYYDPVEAYVWYYLASRNFEDVHDEGGASRFLRAAQARARAKRGILLADMNSEQREEARERITYILSCRGSEGFDELGRIYDTDYATPHMEGHGPGDQDYIGITSDSVMAPSDAEALLYFHIAESMGDPIARYYLNDVEGRLRSTEIGRHIIEEQAKRFHFWAPRLEYYPTGDNDSGIPYSDECPLSFRREQALSLVPKVLPARAIKHALYFLGWDHEGSLSIKHFQLTIGDDATGILTAVQSVRLIQTAAVRGDAESQNNLGVMYAKGIGVIRNYVRAAHWFEKAADQRYGAAVYHLGVLYKVGPEGIQQNLSRANDYFTAAALDGFRPSMNQLHELLLHAEAKPPHAGQT